MTGCNRSTQAQLIGFHQEIMSVDRRGPSKDIARR
jgi:hypothetical protein